MVFHNMGLQNKLTFQIMKQMNFLNAYFLKFPEIKTYMDNTIKFCRKSGYVNNIFDLLFLMLSNFLLSLIIASLMISDAEPWMGALIAALS